MCTVSMIARDWQDRHPRWIPPIDFQHQVPTSQDLAKFFEQHTPVTRAEFDSLKAELESLKKLLAAAKQYDTETGQKDCEEADKIALFKKLAEVVGVDLAQVFEGK